MQDEPRDELEAVADDAGPQAEDEPEESLTLDETQVQQLKERLSGEQNLLMGVVAGLAASLIGAAVWAIITVVTNFQIGFMAIGVGVLVGMMVRRFGNGIDNTFGVIGAVFALVGCVLGNLFAFTAIHAQNNNISFGTQLSRLDLSTAISLMQGYFGIMDLIFYGIALYEGYKLAFRRVTADDIQRLLGPDAGRVS